MVKIKKKDLFTEEQARLVADTITKLFIEIEKMYHQVCSELIQEEELKSIFLKTELIKNKLQFNVHMYNSKTKTKVIKVHSIAQILSLSQANVIGAVIVEDVQKMHNESNKKINSEDIEIMI